MVHISHRVFNGIHAMIRHGSVAGETVEVRCIFVAPLVSVDDPHVRRFTDDCHTGGQTTFGQRFRQMPGTHAPDLFVIGKGKMHRAFPNPFCKIRGHCKSRGDETLHVTGASAI